MPAKTDYRQSRTDKVKHLFWIAKDPLSEQPELRPYLFFEVRIDFNDIRTGFRETVSLSKALEIYSSTADMLWTEDMIRDIDTGKATPSVPDGFSPASLPEFVDVNFMSRMENQFSQFLLRSFETRIYRNFDLNLYSFSGESRSDFARRCLELYDGPKRSELDRLHELFTRKLEQIKQKYLGPADPDSLEQTKVESSNRDIFSRCSERIAEMFLHADLVSQPAAGAFSPPPGMPELEIRLGSLELESQQAVFNLCSSYEGKAGAIDEYILHPNLKDIHFVRSCILWMPQGAV